MDSFAEGAAHGLGQKDRGIAVLIAQTVGSRKGSRPLFPAVAFQEVHLLGKVLEVGSMHSQQTNGASFLPIVVEESERDGKNFSIHLCRIRQGLRAGNGAEV